MGQIRFTSYVKVNLYYFLAFTMNRIQTAKRGCADAETSDSSQGQGQGQGQQMSRATVCFVADTMGREILVSYTLVEHNSCEWGEKNILCPSSCDYNDLSICFFVFKYNCNAIANERNWPNASRWRLAGTWHLNLCLTGLDLLWRIIFDVQRIMCDARGTHLT